MDVGFPPTEMKKHFPKECCVAGCETKAEDEHGMKQILFRFVPRPTTQMAESRKNMISKRFWMWIDILGQNPCTARYLWVCHKHFVTGRPAAPFNHWETDWIPNLNLNMASRTTPDDLLDNTSFTIPVEEPLDGESYHSLSDPDLEGPFCRFCFRVNVSMRPMFPSPRVDKNHLITLIEEVTCIRLEFSDDYNSFICHECQQNMEIFFKYRKMWQANDLLLRTSRENNSFAKPTPIVAIPIDHLMEDPSQKTDFLEVLPCSSQNYSLVEQLLQNSLEDECPDQNVLMNLEDTKPPFVEPSEFGASLVYEQSITETCVKKEPHEESEVKSTEQNEKDMLIEQVMRQVRRETLSPKKDNHRHSKKHKPTKRLQNSKNRMVIKQMVSNKNED